MGSEDDSEFRESVPKRVVNRGQTDVNRNSTIEMAVFLMNETPIVLKLKDKTSSLTANDLMNEVFKEGQKNNEINLKFDPKYKQLFSIWITSSYLELQLQPDHKPFCVLAKWDYLLKKHGPTQLFADLTLIEKDEPTLSFQRNVFCDQILEREISDADIGALYLLYYESKMNVLDGRYPLATDKDADPDRDDTFELLAAYQAAIESGNYNKTDYSVEYFRQHLKEYIPYNYIKGSEGNKFNLIRTLSRRTPALRCAQTIHDLYKKVSEEELSKHKLLRSYLEICWRIPSYGSAYFSAQIEKPIKSKIDSLVNHFDLEVWVAINQTGLHVISKEKPEILLSIDYMDLCWAVGCPESSDPNCIPCIFITIPNQSDNILQIFSRQYRLIETLLNSFIRDTKSAISSRNNSISSSERNSNRDSYDVIDGPIPAPVVVRPVYSQQISVNSKVYKPERLSLAKFTESGQFKNKTGSWVRNKKKN